MYFLFVIMNNMFSYKDQRQIKVYFEILTCYKLKRSMCFIVQTCLFTTLGAGIQMDAVYTEFAKAFDKVDHLLLINKLSLMGVSESLLNWIFSYLVDKIQIVRVERQYSEEYMASLSIILRSFYLSMTLSSFLNIDLFFSLRMI